MKRSELMKKMRESKAIKRVRPRLNVEQLKTVIKRISQVGKPTPTIKVLISLPPSLNAQLDRAAKRHNITKSLLVRQLIVKNRARVGKP